MIAQDARGKDGQKRAETLLKTNYSNLVVISKSKGLLFAGNAITPGNKF